MNKEHVPLSDAAKARVATGVNAKDRARLWALEQDKAQRAARRKRQVRGVYAERFPHFDEGKADDLGESFD